MRRLLFAAALGAVLVAPTPAGAALLPQQVDAVLALLDAFGASESVVANVRAALRGGASTAPSAAGSLGFAAAVQPPPLRLLRGTERVPFTAVSLVNNTNAVVDIYTVTIERQGSGTDSAISTVSLLGDSMVASASGFDSKHQVNLPTNGLTLAAGASATITIAGDISSKKTRSGRTVGLTVLAINASAPLLGTLPIGGTLHTLD